MIDLTGPREPIGAPRRPPQTDGINDESVHVWLPARVYETLAKLALVQDRTLEQQARYMLRGMLGRREHEGEDA